MSNAKPAEAKAAREREFTWHDSVSGWHDAAVGYARQKAARQAARAAQLPPEPHGPPAPQPPGYDAIINGLWDGRPKVIVAAAKSAPPSVPAAYNYDRETDWRNYVEAGGSIRSRPRGRWGRSTTILTPKQPPWQ